MSESSFELRRSLSQIQSISDILKSTSSVFSGLQSQINENLEMKEKNIRLQSANNYKTNQMNKKEADYKFMCSQYENEIQSLQDIQNELKSAIDDLSREKEVSIQKLQNSYSSTMQMQDYKSNEAFQTLQKRIKQLQEENASLHIQNENIIAENKKLEIINQSYARQDEIDFDNNEQRLNAIRSNYQKDGVQISKLHARIKDQKQNYIESKENLENKYVDEQRSSLDLKGELEMALKHVEILSKQNKEMKAHSEKLASKLVASKKKARSIIIEIDTLRNHSSNLEDQLAKENKKASIAQKRIAFCNSVGYCSPLQQQRINLMKVVVEDRAKIYQQIIGSQKIGIRSIVLFVLFANRWSAITNSTTNDIATYDGLNRISCQNPISLSSMISKIQKEIAELETRAAEDRAAKSSLSSRICGLRAKTSEGDEKCRERTAKLQMTLRCNELLSRHATVVLPEY